VTATQQTPNDILAFWFKELTPKQWWVSSDELDRQIASRFTAVHAAAERCELYAWRETPHGA